jgi:D-threonate/D-erythronate kinase
MTQLAIIADDLSSATDCGAQVARSGEPVVVPLVGFTLPAQAQGAHVISVDTNSRSLSPAQAYAAVQTAAHTLVAQGWQHFYKSVDSTVRGNLGAEIDAVLDESHATCAIIAPAFPKYGRTTRDGVQYLSGVPLHQTEFGTDPTNPVRESDLTKLLASQSKRKAGRISLAQLRQGPTVALAQLNQLLVEGVELVIVDVEEQEDLKRVCTNLSGGPASIVWVGSTGLAEFVPLAAGLGQASQAATHTGNLDPRPALIVVGSGSETTRQQLAYAQTNVGLHLIPLNPAAIVSGGVDAQTEIENVLASLTDSLAHNNAVALAVLSTRADIAATQQLGATLGLTPPQVAGRIAEALAHLGRTVALAGAISGIVATGGDTAKALCDALQVEALEIIAEVEAGIPVMRLLGPVSLPFVTKAGGFGSPAALATSIEMVKQYA